MANVLKAIRAEETSAPLPPQTVFVPLLQTCSHGNKSERPIWCLKVKVSSRSFVFIKQIVLSTSDDAVVSLKLFHLFHLLARLVPIGSIRDLGRAICDRFHDCGPGCLGKPIVFVAGA